MREPQGAGHTLCAAEQSGRTLTVDRCKDPDELIANGGNLGELERDRVDPAINTRPDPA